MFAKIVILALAVTACAAGPSQIARPCNMRDNKCVRDNLAANSRCSRAVRGFVPPKYTIKTFRFDTPFFNATYIDHDLVIRNHNSCYVSEFFFNIASDTLVLSLDCPNLDFESSRTLVQHSSFQEDSTYSYSFKGTYPLVRLTVNFPHANTLDLCTAFTFADVTELPTFHINPNDKETENFLSQDLSLTNIFERETFFYRANELARFYINSMICDFGCNF